MGNRCVHVWSRLRRAAKYTRSQWRWVVEVLFLKKKKKSNEEADLPATRVVEHPEHNACRVSKRDE